MDYKGKDDREKGKNRACSKGSSDYSMEDYKPIVGENRCNNISFRPLTGYFQREKSVDKRIEFFPKLRIRASFGKNSTLMTLLF